MSLLTSLLEYSSLNNSNRQQRSMSSSNRFFDDMQNQYTKPSSKSVSKMNITPLTTNIDPKTRILHRIAHRFSMKFRKYFYQFFIKLENMKKTGFSMKAAIEAEQMKKKYSKAVQKLDQTYNICYSKVFQKIYKTETFNKIKQISVKNQAVRKFANICENNYILMKKNSFFDRLRNIQKLHMKLEIFCSGIVNALRSKIYQQTQMSEMHQFIGDAFQLIKNRYISIKQAQGGFNGKQESFTPTKIVQKTCIVHDSLIDVSAISNRSNSYRKEQLPSSTRKKSYNEPFSINFSGCKQSMQQSPVKASNPLSFFVSYQIAPTLSAQGCLSNWKAFPYCLNYSQQPISLQISKQPQSKPRQYSKIQQDKISNQIGDIHDKFKIFNQFKNQLESNYTTQNSKISNFCEAQNYYGTFGRIFDASHQEKSKSSIVYGTNLSNSESLTHLLSSRDKVNLVHFGSQAVNFKNLLVTQRESMRKNQFRQIYIDGQQSKTGLQFKKKDILFNDCYDIDALCQSSAKKYPNNEPLSVKSRPIKSSSITNNNQSFRMPQKKMEWKRHSVSKGTFLDSQEHSNLQLSKFGFSVPMNSEKNKSFSNSDGKFWKGLGTTKQSERPTRESHGFIAQKRPSISIGNTSLTTKRPSSGDTWQSNKACQYIKLKHRKN